VAGLRSGESASSIKTLRSDVDPDLKLVNERWPDLSLELRQAIVKMVR
jgi:hypothetical protein